MGLPSEFGGGYDMNLANLLGSHFQSNHCAAFDTIDIDNSSTHVACTTDNRDLDVDFESLALSVQFWLSLTDRAFLFSQVGIDDYQ